MTRETETLFYNIRMLIDSKVESEPRAWLISKVNRISPNGICRVTLTQDNFDQHKDYVEKDDNGNIIGMWANYFISNVEPKPIPIDDIIPSPTATATITCSGKQQIRIGGSAKTFTVVFADEDGASIDALPGTWEFSIDGESVQQELLTLSITGNRVKVKFLGDDSYIGKILTVTYKVDGEDITSSINVELLPL